MMDGEDIYTWRTTWVGQVNKEGTTTGLTRQPMEGMKGLG
jgi:hypothetical protein